MAENTTTARHARHHRPTFGADHASDGVSDEVAIMWSDQEQLRRSLRTYFIEGAHRAYA